MTPKEANERQDIFLSSVKHAQKICMLLLNEGFANCAEEDGPVIPVWCSEADAEACGKRSFPEYRARSFKLSQFLNELLPAFEGQGVWFAVQPNEEFAGSQLPTATLADEFDKYHA